MAKIYVINNLGEKEVFSKSKVFNSARRAGASKELAREIVKKIEKEIYDGIPTNEIYEKIKTYLFQTEVKAGIRYSLKESIRKLGPAGFYFEKYIGEIFKKLGFQVKLNQLVKGKYVDNYEIDFLAEKDKQLILAECKFHHLPSSRVDLKVALIVYSRFLDIKKGGVFKGLRIRPMIITNTKFTSQVIKYAEGYKIDLLGWHYPIYRGLEYLIESEKMYPVTILPSANSFILSILARNNVMLVSDLIQIRKEELKNFGLKENQIKQLKEEAYLLFYNSD
ncbi:MAG: ATP cone domain-containing protein [Minisyncoccia bacterium]